MSTSSSLYRLMKGCSYNNEMLNDFFPQCIIDAKISLFRAQEIPTRQYIMYMDKVLVYVHLNFAGTVMSNC